MRIESVDQMPRVKTVNTVNELTRDPLQNLEVEQKRSIRVQQPGQKELRQNVDREASREYDRGVLEESIDKLNQVLMTVNPRFEFRVHEETNRLIVRVWDKDTEELIREIPPEQILDIVASIEEMVGILVDKRL